MSDADEMIDMLNVLCEDFGCEAGSNRLHWLHEQLSELTSLRSQNKGMREALEPFAQMADWLPEDGPVARIRVTDEHDYAITGKDLHRAKAALLRALSNGSKEGA